MLRDFTQLGSLKASFPIFPTFAAGCVCAFVRLPSECALAVARYGGSRVYVQLSGTRARLPSERRALMDVNVD